MRDTQTDRQAGRQADRQIVSFFFLFVYVCVCVRERGGGERQSDRQRDPVFPTPKYADDLVNSLDLMNTTFFSDDVIK